MDLVIDGRHPRARCMWGVVAFGCAWATAGSACHLLSSYESVPAAPDASAADQRAADAALWLRDQLPGDAAGPPSRTYDVFVGIQGDSHSYVLRLRYSPDASTTPPLVAAERALRLEGIDGPWARALAFDASGTMILAGGGDQETAAQESLVERIALSSFSRLTPVRLGHRPEAPPEHQPDNVHGLCSLPGGNLVVGDFGFHGRSRNAVAEYALAPASDQASFLAKVYTTQLQVGSMSQCTAVTDDEIYVLEFAANTDDDARLVRFERDGLGDWGEGAHFDMTVFAPGRATGVWAFVLHSDGHAYLFPSVRIGGRVNRLIRCPTPSLAGCSEVGELPPDSGGDNGPDAISGAAQIPGSQDMLFATNSALYRYYYSRSNDAPRQYEKLYELGNVELPGPTGERDTPRVVRNILVRAGGE